MICRMTGRRSWWRSGLGGAAMLAIVLVPLILLAVAPRSALLLHDTTTSGFDLGGFLSILPGVAAVALLAPLVGCRRRDALLMVIPVANLYLAWIVGSRAAHLSATGASAPASASLGATSTDPAFVPSKSGR
jgi:hypothetical protein